jgi:cell division transport system permease protein
MKQRSTLPPTEELKTKSLRIVPPSGLGVWLTGLTAAAMSFLAVFAMALALTAGLVAQNWSSELQGRATIRILPSNENSAQQLDMLLQILAQTPGILKAQPLDSATQTALLAPWLGDDIPFDALPLPQLLDVTYAGERYDFEGLRLRLAAELPDAIIDDHMQFRGPILAAAQQLRWLGYGALGLILSVTAMMVVLAANAALAANGTVIKVLQLVGATDRYIVRAFVRRFAFLAFLGACFGCLCAVLALHYMPKVAENSGFLRAFGFVQGQWIWPVALPFFVAGIAYIATRWAGYRKLKELI